MTDATNIPHNPASLSHPKYRADIDGLRAVAVLSVVGFHAFPDAVRGGFIGVDIFFIISGFLISSIIFSNLEHNSFTLVGFYTRRIKRIFPALLLVLSASYIFGWFELLADEYKQLGRHIAGGAGFVSNFVLWSESGYFDNAAETKPLLHLWSLAIEEQFYIIWPLLLAFAWKRKTSFVAVTIMVAALSFAVNVYAIHKSPTAAFYSPLSRFWELMLGCLLAYLAIHKPHLHGKHKDAQSIFGFLLLALGLAFIKKTSAFPGWWALLPTLGAFFIISADQSAALNKHILSSRPLVWIGLISYPLYLWHWPLLSFARIVEGAMPAHGIRFAAVIASFGLAWLTYKLVEKPIRFGSHGKIKTVALLASMGVVGYIGYDCHARDGLGFRLPKIVQEFTQYKYKLGGKWEKNFCFLSPEQDHTAFNACEPSPLEGKKPSILLWGDSHASHLSTGYRARFGEEFAIIQRTTSTCPPILNLDMMIANPHCKEINDHVFEYVKKTRPDKIVLAAAWNKCKLGSFCDWRKAEQTIIELKKLGITNIDVVGPVPQWIESLPKQLYLYYKSDALKRIPERMDFGLEKSFMQTDALMSAFFKNINVNYISPAKIMCDESGCITRLGETGDTLTAFDYGHLTDAGSIFAVSKFPSN